MEPLGLVLDVGVLAQLGQVLASVVGAEQQLAPNVKART